MDSYLTKIWNAATEKLGALSAIAPLIADKVKVALKENDAAEIRVRAMELRECAAAQDALADAMIQAVDDGTITLTEGSELALLLEKVIDQAEDVIKGYDEDDPAVE